MTYEEALEIAMEELYDAVNDLRYNNKGYHAHIERQCNRLLTARNAIHKGLEDAEKKREADKQVGAWLSAALHDPNVCQSMKDDINEWFECTPQEEVGRLRAKKKQIYEDLKDAVDREWVGLTDEEEDSIMRQCHMQGGAYLLLFRLVEAKLKEKNGNDDK